MNITLAAGIWAAFAVTLLIFLAYRKMVTSHEDDSIHLEHQTAKTADQAVLAQKVDSLDKWGKWLTAVTLLYGIVLVCY